MDEITRLKKKARAAYLKATQDTGWHAGWHMTETIRPDIGLARREFNETMAELEKLDPECPKGQRL